MDRDESKEGDILVEEIIMGLTKISHYRNSQEATTMIPVKTLSNNEESTQTDPCPIVRLVNILNVNIELLSSH